MKNTNTTQKENTKKKHPYRKIVLSSIGIAIIILIIICGLFLTPQEQEVPEEVIPENTVITIAVSKHFPMGHTIDEAGSFTAQYFDDNEVTFQWIDNIDNDADIAQMLSDGRANFALLPMLSTFQAFEQTNQTLRVISWNTLNNSCVVLAPDDGGITRMDQLKGATIGVEFGTYSHFFLLQKLKENNLSEKDVHLLDLDGPSLISAYGERSIDAGCFTTYDASRYWKNGVTLQLAISTSDAIYLCGQQDFMVNHPDLTSKMVLLYQDMTDYTINHLETAAQMVSQQENRNIHEITTLFESLVDRSGKPLNASDYQIMDEALAFSLEQSLIQNEYSSYRMTNFAYLNLASSLRDKLNSTDTKLSENTQSN